MTNPSELDPGDVEDAFRLPDEDIEAWAKTVDEHRDYRVLRRLRSGQTHGTLTGPARIGVIVDTETTGVKDTSRVIELGLVRFEYDDEGHVGRVTSGAKLQDPGEPLTPFIVELTGLTDAKLKGQQVPVAWVKKFLAGADLCIAYHAGFDRPMVERCFAWAGFETMPWACAMTEIPYRAMGVQPGPLGYILTQFGAFHEAHTAQSDAEATLHILAQPDPAKDFLDVGRTVLSRLLESFKRPWIRVWAWDSPIATKDDLRERGYRWDVGRRVWSTLVAEPDIPAEQKWLKAKIYRGMEFGAKMAPVSRLDMYSTRG